MRIFSSDLDEDEDSTKSKNDSKKQRVFKKASFPNELEKFKMMHSSPKKPRTPGDVEWVKSNSSERIFPESSEEVEFMVKHTSSDVMNVLSKEFFEKYARHQRKSLHGENESSQQVFYENSKFLNSFSQKEVIGHGSFGKVYRVFHKLEGYYYAVKKIKLEVPHNFDVRELDIY